MEPKQPFIRWVAVGLAVAAAMICFLLLNKHVAGTSGVPMFDAGCTVAAAGQSASCEKVLASPYAYILPLHRDKPDKAMHVPTALVGLVYYSGLVLWFFGVGRPDWSRRRVHLVPMLLIAVGLVGSAYYSYIMFTVLTEWCPWCAVTHVLNLLIAACAVLMRPREPRPDSASPRGAVDPDKQTAAPWPAHPTRGVIAIVLLAIAGTTYGHIWRYSFLKAGSVLQQNLRDLGVCKAEVELIKADARGMVATWQATRQTSYKINETDVVRGGAGGKTMEVVIFSDFECPSCRDMAQFFEARIEPMFAGNLRVAYKHYPLNSDCNARVPDQMHKHACKAAGWAEAARLVGGNEAFWKAHDYLFTHQPDMKSGKLDLDAVASALGLDTTAMSDAARSEQAGRRVWEDVNLAQTMGVQSTPTVFVDGRMVNSLARRQENFWDELANYYWTNIAQQPRPDSTKLVKPTTTRDTPDPKGAP